MAPSWRLRYHVSPHAPWTGWRGHRHQPLTPHPFIPGLKPTFSANPSHRSLPFFFRTDYINSPDFYCYFWAYPFLLISFFSVLHFLVVVSARYPLCFIHFMNHISNVWSWVSITAGIFTGWAKKTGLFFRLDNFVTVRPRKACSMSKFSQFYREKGTKLAFQWV